MSTLLSRILAFLLSIIALFTGNGKANSVTIEIQDDVTTQSETIVYEVTNYTAETISSGESFVFEKNQDGEWVEVEAGPVLLIGWTIKPFQTFKGSIDIEEAFGHKLEAGEYRLTKPYSSNFSGDSCSTIFNVLEA